MTVSAHVHRLASLFTRFPQGSTLSSLVPRSHHMWLGLGIPEQGYRKRGARVVRNSAQSGAGARPGNHPTWAGSTKTLRIYHGQEACVLMFKRKKIHSELDAYIRRRYEDQAVSIHYDMKNGRGTHSYYAPWLEAMLQRQPSDQLREKHSKIYHQPQQQGKRSTAWEERPGIHRQAAGSQIPEAILESLEEEEEEEKKWKAGKKGEGEKKDYDGGVEVKARDESTTQGAVSQENTDHRLLHRQRTERPVQNQTVSSARQSRICTIL